MTIKRLLLCVLFMLPAACVLAGCSSKLAKTGWATVTDVTPVGVARIQYENGEAAWKRLDDAKLRETVRTALENRYKPARYVETEKGSTITFRDGKTLLYYQLH